MDGYSTRLHLNYYNVYYICTVLQAKNSSHRFQVEKAVKDGLQIPSLPSVHTLSQDFIDEALILSDILDLNEISSVELLLAGEQQLPRCVCTVILCDNI